MPNHVNNTPPADFKVFLATLKGIFPASEAKAFAKFVEEYDRVGAERMAFTREAAEHHIRELGRRAQEDPSIENLEAVKQCSPVEVYSRFDNTLTQIALVQEALLQRAKPVIRRLGDAVLPVVDREIKKVEADAVARFSAYGTPYEPTADVLLMSLKRWRDIVADHFSGSRCTLHPSQVIQRLGEIRAKSGFLS